MAIGGENPIAQTDEKEKNGGVRYCLSTHQLFFLSSLTYERDQHAPITGAENR